jgi:hypothetical protein
MSLASTALDFANVVNFVAVLFLMRSIIRDRNVLRGFSVSGTFLTFIAILSFEIAYALMGILTSFALGLVSLAFWLLAFVFTFRKFISERAAKVGP